MRNVVSLSLWVCLSIGAGNSGPLAADEKTKDSKDDNANVKSIIDKAIAAHGGESKIAKLKTATIKVQGKQTVPGQGDVPCTLEDSWQLPNQYRTQIALEVKGMTLTQLLILNGEKGWISLNKFSQEMDPKMVAEMKEQLYAETLDKLFPLRDKGYELSSLGETKINEKDALGIKVSSQGHKDVSLYFDKATGLCVKRAHRILDSSGKEVLQEVVFSDFKDVDGVKHFQKITAFRNGQKMIEGEVTELKFFDKLEEKLFAKPE